MTRAPRRCPPSWGKKKKVCKKGRIGANHMIVWRRCCGPVSEVTPLTHLQPSGQAAQWLQARQCWKPLWASSHTSRSPSLTADSTKCDTSQTWCSAYAPAASQLAGFFFFFFFQVHAWSLPSSSLCAKRATGQGGSTFVFIKLGYRQDAQPTPREE